MGDLSGMPNDKLQALHRAKRQQIAALKAELADIEAVLTPRLNKEQALAKIVRAGLSEAEMIEFRNFASQL